MAEHIVCCRSGAGLARGTCAGARVCVLVSNDGRLQALLSLNDHYIPIVSYDGVAGRPEGGGLASAALVLSRYKLQSQDSILR